MNFQGNPPVLGKVSSKIRKNHPFSKSVWSFTAIPTSFWGIFLNRDKKTKDGLMYNQVGKTFGEKDVQIFSLKTWVAVFCIVENITNPPCDPVPKPGTTIETVCQKKVCRLRSKPASTCTFTVGSFFPQFPILEALGQTPFQDLRLFSFMCKDAFGCSC